VRQVRHFGELGSKFFDLFWLRLNFGIYMLIVADYKIHQRPFCQGYLELSSCIRRLKARHIDPRMPQTLSLNLVHIVFSTKARTPLIHDEIAPRLHAYLAGTARELGWECFRVGGVADHVHLALRLPSTKTAADVVSRLKTSSSAWMKEQGVAHFCWQRGYGLFSVGPTDLDALVRYIDGQKEHHARKSFQDEMRAFLTRYGMSFDERYLWD